MFRSVKIASQNVVIQFQYHSVQAFLFKVYTCCNRACQTSCVRDKLCYWKQTIETSEFLQFLGATMM